MNLDQFIGASLDNRTTFVLRWGTLLAVRHWGSYEISLYDIGRFFAEVWLDKKESRIIMISAFKDHQCFSPYLEEITLPQLFCP
jgi:hypothetical protein